MFKSSRAENYSKQFPLLKKDLMGRRVWSDGLTLPQSASGKLESGRTVCRQTKEKTMDGAPIT